MKRPPASIRSIPSAKVALLVALAAAVPCLEAASPSLGSILPRGGQVGTEVVLDFNGDRLDDAEEVILHDEGLVVKALAVENAKLAKVTVEIPADCRIGEHRLRLRCRGGITELRTFWVGPFPTVAEAEPNSDFAAPQRIGMNVTVDGVAENEDVDHYAVEAKKGDRLSVEVEAIRLGLSLFDPYVAILNDKRFELVARDDTALLVQDAFASVVIPEDGTYVVQVRDSSYTGNGNFRYRLHVGDFPRPAVVYPPGGRAGEELEVTFVGDVSGDIEATVTLPGEAVGSHALFADSGGRRPPSPNPIRVVEFPNILEAEPNASRDEATAATTELPVALNGLIGEDGDEDWFTFPGRKDQKVEIRVHARSVGSPLDSVLNLFGPDGQHIAGDDDGGSGPDARTVQTLPADGEYAVRVRDHLGQGGPEYVYRVEVTPVKPSLTVSIPRFERNDSQARQTIPVPRGNRYAVLFNASREEFGGDLAFEVPGLPPGVAFHAETMPASINVFPVVFEAAPDAPLAGGLLDVVARHADPATGIVGGFSQNVELVLGPPNNTVFYRTADPGKLPLSVVEEVPFSIDLETPSVPLVQNGIIDLKVVATRAEGFTKPITLRMLWNPPGIGSPGTIQIPEGQNEALYRLNANGNAAVSQWKIAILGEADGGNGTVFASTSLTPLEVAPPFVTAKLEMAAVEKGKATSVVCRIEHQRPFEGEARIELVGLPAKCMVEPLAITADTTEIAFPVTTEEETPVGTHKNLFCSLAIPQAGTVVPHTVGQGGVFRVDNPPPAPAEPAPAPSPEAGTAKAVETPPEKRLSRLEQLRLAAKEARERRRRETTSAADPQARR